MAGDPHFNRVSLLLPMTGSNGSTTFTDASPTPKTMTVFGNAQISTAQDKWGTGSGYFDGTGDYLRTPYAGTNLDISTGDFTIELWVYLNSVTGQQCLVGVHPNAAAFSPYGWNIRAFDNGLFFYAGNSNTSAWEISIYSPNTPNISTWRHLAICRLNDVFTFFMDGVAGTPATAAGLVIHGDTYLSVGRILTSTVGGERYLNAYVQDFRITKNFARYTADFTPPAAPFPTYLEPRALELYAVNRPIVQAFNPTIFNG